MTVTALLNKFKKLEMIKCENVLIPVGKSTATASQWMNVADEENLENQIHVTGVEVRTPRQL